METAIAAEVKLEAGQLTTKFNDWPLWVQLLVGVPHALLAGILAWVWRPLQGRSLYWAVGTFALSDFVLLDFRAVK
jgi:CHASE2 domain-containing sensor protein